MELGIQSYCLRGVHNAGEVIKKTKECGLRRIEVCAIHADFSDIHGFAELVEQYTAGGVAMVSIGVNRIGTERDEARRLFECAKVAGLDRMSVDFPLDGIDEALVVAEELAEEYGVVLGIHNHGGRHWLGSRTALRWVFGKTGNRVGLNLDTAWALDSREDPIEMVKEFGDRLHLVHIKDFLFKPDRTPEDVVVGTGNLSLETLDAALREVAFSGEAILEYEGDVENPVPALSECVKAVGSKMQFVTTKSA